MYDTQDPMPPMTPLTADELKCPHGEPPASNQPRERLVQRASQPPAAFMRPAAPFLTPPKPLYPASHEPPAPQIKETKAIAPVIIEPCINEPARNVPLQYATFHQIAVPVKAVPSHKPIVSSHSVAYFDPDPFPDLMNGIGDLSETDDDQEAEEEDEPDAVLTENMPVPVPVPISPITLPKASHKLTYVMVAVTVLITLLGAAFVASQQHLPKPKFSAPTEDHIPAVSFAFGDTPCP
ncbi:MAG: hypothetical protein RR696_02280 [Clostridia bacterium]